jgi:DNA adenine methylase
MSVAGKFSIAIALSTGKRHRVEADRLVEPSINAFHSIVEISEITDLLPDTRDVKFTGDPKAKTSFVNPMILPTDFDSSANRRPSQILLFSRAGAELKPRPFLKWAGGKNRLLGDLRRSVPREFKRYIEPFLGGGAMFFDLLPQNAYLSDSNEELVQCYKTVARHPRQLIQFLERLQNTDEEFYRARATRPETLDDIARAARFIFLNKTCYNGLYRVNKQGHFNTPYGHYGAVSLFDRDNIFAVSRSLQNQDLFCMDYRRILEIAERGDFIYLDPPYLPVGKFADFKRYTKESFHGDDHVHLAGVFKALSDRGCHVLLSNSFHPTIASLYREFSQATVFAPRYVNCKGDKRGKIKELLIANYPINGEG